MDDCERREATRVTGGGVGGLGGSVSSWRSSTTDSTEGSTGNGCCVTGVPMRSTGRGRPERKREMTVWSSEDGFALGKRSFCREGGTLVLLWR